MLSPFCVYSSIIFIVQVHKNSKYLCEKCAEFTTVQHLTEAVVPGAEGERWVLIAVYEQGLAATSKVGTEPARKMDYFSEAGTRAFTDFYDTQVFDDELRAMMRQNGGDLFSDSYGADSNWTEGFLDIFQAQKGYDLTPYLPVLFHQG